jgi:DGQHR domain-containing protein
MILKLIKITQGTDGAIYSGKITVAQLLSSYKIDVFSPNNQMGYQRELDEKRARKFATFLKEEISDGRKPAIPTSILLSYRKKINGTITDYGIEAVFNDEDRLYIVDGQHRTNGFKFAIEQYGLNELLKFELPIVIFENPFLVNEVKQFLLINNNMKKVRTDLARELMIKLKRTGGMEIPASEDDAIRATHITKLLNSSAKSPWLHKLNGPGDPKEGHYLNTQLSLANSIKATVLKHPATSRMTAETACRELCKYWTAWEKLMPEAFSEDTYKEYLITKNNGFVTLHHVFSYIYSHLKHVKGINEPTVEDYLNIIKKTGEVSEPEYWSREDGDAKQFGGGFGGFKNFADFITGELADNGIES